LAPRPRRRRTPSPTAEQRRERRSKARRKIVLHGLAAPGQRFDQLTSAQDFSLRGMSLILPMPLPLDSPVLAENPETGVRTLYRVVHLEALEEGSYRVGLEAPEPHPRFWPQAQKRRKK